MACMPPVVGGCFNSLTPRSACRLHLCFYFHAFDPRGTEGTKARDNEGQLAPQKFGAHAPKTRARDKKDKKAGTQGYVGIDHELSRIVVAYRGSKDFQNTIQVTSSTTTLALPRLLKLLVVGYEVLDDDTSG